MVEAADIAKDLVLRQKASLPKGAKISNGTLNALRHSYWMATAVILGVDPYMATSFGIEYEMDGAETGTIGDDDKPHDGVWNSSDSNTDLNNNQVGAQVRLDVVRKSGGGVGSIHQDSQDAYDEIANMVENHGCNAGGCIDTSSQLP
jgi:hypothetical protein